MDPMSDVLSLLKPTDFGFRGLEAAGSWSIDFPGVAALKCNAVQSGACWLQMDDGSAPLKLEAGDLVLMSGATGYRLYSDVDAPPIDGLDLFLSFPAGETAMLNGGGEVIGVGGYFKFASAHASLLLGILPTVVHIRAGSTGDALLDPIQRLMRELRDPRPGGDLIGRHLAQALLVEALRLHITEGPPHHAGWLYALGDHKIRTAMAAIHADPARRWTLRDLAIVAGMSRTNFATRFKERLGETAMEYLTRWRMLLAADRLSEGRASIATIAPLVGYESESAFGATFKRVLGLSPRKFAMSVSEPGSAEIR